jgi:hypothetical protein
MGASGRESDPAGCRAAMEAGDGDALLNALGFDEQQLRADVLDAGRTVYSRRAGSLEYFETGEAPLAALTDELLPAVPASLKAYEFTFWGSRKGRTVRLRMGRNVRGLSNLQAAQGLAVTAFNAPEGARHSQSAPGALQDLAGMPVPVLGDDWWGMECRVVTFDGTLARAKVGRDALGWFVVEAATSTLEERLEAERDRRLELLRRMAADLLRSAGRWPRYMTDLTVRQRDLVDPAVPAGRRGWAELAKKPKATIRLLQPKSDDDVAVECVHAGPRGRRVITRGGTLGWR